MGSSQTPSLDLHGVFHADVWDAVSNFVLLHQEELPVEIIYGNSTEMRRRVLEVLEHYDFMAHPGFKNAYGRLLVVSKSDPLVQDGRC